MSKQVRIFRSYDHRGLQDIVNDYLENFSYLDVDDIKYSSAIYIESPQEGIKREYSAMIIINRK